MNARERVIEALGERPAGAGLTVSAPGSLRHEPRAAKPASRAPEAAAPCMFCRYRGRARQEGEAGNA